MAKIGFIGLGIMGRPMAGHLLAGGHQLFAHSRRAPPKELTDKGAVACSSGREVGRNAEVIANQIIVALTIEAVSEALLFASKAGADPARVRQALMGGFAASRILEVHGERMIKRNFEPGFRIALHQKDLNLALQGARSLGVSLPNTATCQELFNAAVAAGGAAWDHSGMARVLEGLARHEIGQGKASA